MTNQNAYLRETVDLIEILATYSGALIPPAELSFAAIPVGADRGTAVFKPADVINGRVGYKLDGTLPAGKYELLARRTPNGGGTAPVEPCGTFLLY